MFKERKRKVGNEKGGNQEIHMKKALALETESVGWGPRSTA